MIDDHAHPFERSPGPFDLARASLHPEEPGRAPPDPPPLWRALLTARLARRLGCDAGEVAAARADAARDYPAHVRGLFADAGISDVLLDAAWPPGAQDHVDDYARLSGARMHLLHRVEPLLDDLLARGAGDAEVQAALDADLDDAARRGCRGFKTVIAYRTGLGVDPEARGDGEKARRDRLCRRLLAFAADTGLPVQVHCGFGDRDLRLSRADPLLLEPLLDTPEGRAAPVVLLHAAWPWVEAAAFLAAARPNVSVDVSLVNLCAPTRTADALQRLLAVAPPQRVLLGTDAYVLPELYWFAATVLREAWALVAADLAARGLDRGWLRHAERGMFEDNARRRYGLS